MNFPSIDIQGSILSSDLLSKIRSEQATYQSGKEFRPDFTNAKLKDEISFAWQEAKGQWTIYKSKLARIKAGEVGTTETRNFWILPLLTNLGYNLTFNRQAEEINGKLFSIGYRDTTLDNFPIYVGGYHESLDKRPENKMLRVSPHAMVQEYLNHSEHMYGIVTNGRQLRLLRDASRITRLSYVEFNLEKMLEEDLYSDFVILYRILHASRMPRQADNGAESIIERYHQEALEAGSAIRSKLGDAVKHAIKDLANGFINHPNNHELREAIQNGKFNIDEYYRHQLRIIYRLLFLFVIEERNLVYAESKTPETKRFNEIYFRYHSLMRLRKIARRLAPPEAHRHFDLWRSLVATFALFEKKQIGEKLGIMSLQGDLFGYHSLTSSSYDLHNCDVSNTVILSIIKSLTYFENDNDVLIAVNYGGLDVEEFGSVYEGLLELRLELRNIEGTSQYSVNWKDRTGGREFQSHYTPEELVQPLIKNSLDYLIANRLKEKDPAAALLSLKVADVACGSGHILLSAARRIAHELASIMETKESGSKEKIEQPSPAYVRKAMKEVVRNCIYGVDKNPLAVELCKVALWLEAFNPGEPLNFLDHHIKCGDAIVGLAHRTELENGIPDEALKTLNGDDKEIAKSWRDQNVRERREREAKALQLKADFEKVTENSVLESIAEYKSFSQLPESNPEEIEKKARAYQKFIDGKGTTFLRAMADTKVAQFFIPKTIENKDYLMTDADFRMILSGYNKSWQDRKVAKATAVALQIRFFHWFIEFPEVIQQGGFDCILGNPPFLGGKKISGSFGNAYLNFIHENYKGVVGQTDLVAFFFRRVFEIIKPGGSLSLISTNSVSEGDTRVSGLKSIMDNGGLINFANISIKWPGVAKLFVTLLSIHKTPHKVIPIFHNGQLKKSINSYLKPDADFGEIFPLQRNENLMYRGVDFGGDGFIIDKNVYAHLIDKDEKNQEVVKPLLNGQDLNNSCDGSTTRYIINFYDWPLEKAKLFEGPFQIVKERVKPYRETVKDKASSEKWWLYNRSRPELYAKLKQLDKCIITAFTSKYLSFSIYDTNLVFSNAINVLASNQHWHFSALQSNVHDAWAWSYSSKLKNDLRYTPSDVFETFPFPENSKDSKIVLHSCGVRYHDHRRMIMTVLQLGLTKTYNLFHLKDLVTPDIEALSKQPKEVCTKAQLDIFKLRDLHAELDLAVVRAYGWHDIRLHHDFYQVDYLPESDRIRYTIHPDARKEILERLLELNHRIRQEEIDAGLWDKKKASSKSKKASTMNEPESGYGSLFSNSQGV